MDLQRGPLVEQTEELKAVIEAMSRNLRSVMEDQSTQLIEKIEELIEAVNNITE